MKTPSKDSLKNHPIKAIRRAAVSLCGFESADPAATIAGIESALNGSASEIPMASWDCARGLSAMNASGSALVSSAGNPDAAVPVDAILTALAKTEVADGILFAHNLHRFMAGDYVVQALWNLRDAWKARRNVLVMMAPAFNLPPELNQDVLIVSEAAPTEAEILDAAAGIADASGGVEEYEEQKIVDATLGYLSRFAVEQSLALSVEKTGTKKAFNLARLWELKVQNLKATAGLEVMLPTESFDDLVGNEGYKDLIGKFLNGREQPRAVLHLDELEKMTAGSTGGDLSGVSQGLMEQFLYWTESRHVKGVLLVGVPGAGKTRAVTCTAGHAKVPHLRASMSTVKGGIVGESEANMKKLLKCVDAVAQGRVLLIATCNSVESLSPELMARFKLATFVFDYPTDVEAAAIWKYYCKKYEFPWTGLNTIPKNVKNWVGREIESCCERAWLFNCSLAEAAKSVVPICNSNKAKMDALRQSVSGRFLSASKMETYNFNANAADKPQQLRKLQ